MMGSNEDGEVLVAKEDVIAKLKDDGDFDKLRLKIIRKIKDNVNSQFLYSFPLGFISYFKFLLNHTRN
jgi:hypothetical protein